MITFGNNSTSLWPNEYTAKTPIKPDFQGFHNETYNISHVK